MFDVVRVPAAALLNNDLRIIEDVQTKDHQADAQLHTVHMASKCHPAQWHYKQAESDWGQDAA